MISTQKPTFHYDWLVRNKNAHFLFFFILHSFWLFFWPYTAPLKQLFYRCFSVQKINKFYKSYFFIFKNYCTLNIILFTPVWVTFIKKTPQKKPTWAFLLCVNQ